MKGNHYHFYNYFTSFLSKQVNTPQFPQLDLHLLQSPWIFSKFKSKSSDAAYCCILCNQYSSFKGQRTCSRILEAITHRPQNSTIALECTSVCCRSAKRKASLSAVVKCLLFPVSYMLYHKLCFQKWQEGDLWLLKAISGASGTPPSIFNQKVWPGATYSTATTLSILHLCRDIRKSTRTRKKKLECYFNFD